MIGLLKRSAVVAVVFGLALVAAVGIAGVGARSVSVAAETARAERISGAAPTTMTREETQETIESYVEALLSGGAYEEFFAEDIVFTMMDVGQEVHGREAAKQAIDNLHHVAFDAAPELRSIVFGEGIAVAEINFVGTHIGEFAGVPATGRPVDVPYTAVWELSGRKIDSLRLYQLASGLEQQILIVLPSSSGALDPYVGTTWLTGAAASAKKGIDVETSYVEANSPYEGVNFVPGIAGADLDDYPSHSIDYAAIMSPTNTGADLSDYPEFTRDYVEITMPESTSTGLNYPTLAAPEDVSTDVHGSTIMLPNAISTGLNYPALLPQSGTSVSRWYIPGESLLPQPGDIVDSNVLPGANLDDYPEHLAELSAITTVPSNVDYQSDFQAMAEANIAASAADLDFPEVAPFNLQMALAANAISVDDEVQDFDLLIDFLTNSAENPDADVDEINYDFVVTSLPNNEEASKAADRALAREELRQSSRLYAARIHLE
jgi:hypothetical protein